MFRLLVLAVVIWLLFTFTEPILARVAEAMAWVGSHIDVTFTL